MAETMVVIVERDRLGRPVQTETFAPGDPLPEWAEEHVPEREVQARDPREETKTAEYCGGPWYKLPTGEKVRGKDAVREAGYAVE
jgi:hypothetical protein